MLDYDKIQSYVASSVTLKDMCTPDVLSRNTYTAALAWDSDCLPQETSKSRKLRDIYTVVI
jgi:hypothetical protein